MREPGKKKIWIDLENSPHVPFFKPIIEELNKRGYSVLLTARDCAQTCGLADLHGLRYIRIGRHYGKFKLLKAIGLLVRVFGLMPTIIREKPALALSHGSRTQLLIASLLGIPTIETLDYEYTNKLSLSKPDWLILPEVVSKSHFTMDKSRILKYPGIKEDIYVPRFSGDSSIMEELKINDGKLVVTIRPPATQAHYFVPESEELFEATIEFLVRKPNIRLIILPRNEKQDAFIRKKWSSWFTAGTIMIPPRVVDGLNLLWYSDLVISGGGTMNREAAALGVPVYSIFRGKIGAVDRYLADAGRLTLLENVRDVHSKIVLAPRQRTERPDHVNRAALKSLIQMITGIAESTISKQTKKIFDTENTESTEKQL